MNRTVISISDREGTVNDFCTPRPTIKRLDSFFDRECADCNGNTPIKISCGVDGHKEGIRKDGLSFYRECAECKSSLVFFTNPG